MDDICCTADELINELREENESLAKSVNEAAESLNKKDKRIAELEKAIRELTRKVKRRDNKIVELAKEIKRLRKLEDTDISIIRACLPELFLGKKIVIARKPKSPKKEPEVIEVYMDEFVGEKEDD